MSLRSGRNITSIILESAISQTCQVNYASPHWRRYGWLINFPPHTVNLDSAYRESNLVSTSLVDFAAALMPPLNPRRKDP